MERANYNLQEQQWRTFKISQAALHELSWTIVIEGKHRYKREKRESRSWIKRGKARTRKQLRWKRARKRGRMRMREREREGEVDSLGDFVRARIRFPNRSNLQLANRRRRQPSNKSNSRRNGRGGGKSESTRLCTANDKKFARSQSRRCGTLFSRATHLDYVHRWNFLV